MEDVKEVRIGRDVIEDTKLPEIIYEKKEKKKAASSA
jgi:hypothetical protein